MWRPETWENPFELVFSPSREDYEAGADAMLKEVFIVIRGEIKKAETYCFYAQDKDFCECGCVTQDLEELLEVFKEKNEGKAKEG